MQLQEGEIAGWGTFILILRMCYACRCRVKVTNTGNPPACNRIAHAVTTVIHVPSSECFAHIFLAAPCSLPS